MLNDHGLSVAVRLAWTIARPALLPMLVGLLGLGFFAALPQGTEVLGQVAEAGLLSWRFLAFTLALALCGLAFWASARGLLTANYHWQTEAFTWIATRQLEGADDATRRRFARLALRTWILLPRGLLTLPFLGACIGLFRAYAKVGSGTRWSMILILVLVCGGLLILVAQRRWRSASPRLRTTEGWFGLLFGRDGPAEDIGETRGMVLRAALAVLTPFLFAVALANVPSWITQKVGAAPIIAVFLASLATVGGLVAWLVMSHRWLSAGWATTITLAYLFVLAWLGLNNDHFVEPLREGAEQERQAVLGRPTLEEHLAGWLRDRRGLGANADAPYPLVVVAAQGGGIRAALWTAETLGALVDRDPRFVCHLFAIAGVSGGSLGALAFHGIVRTQEGSDCAGKAEPGRLTAVAAVSPRQAAARQVLEPDHLAAVITGLLFTDLQQRFFPAQLFTDRQRYMEDSFAAGWRDWFGSKDTHQAVWATWHGSGPAAAPSPDWSTGFVGFVRPERPDTRLPVLLLVTAEVGRGWRWIVSDTRIDPNTFPDAVDLLAGGELPDGCRLAGKPSVGPLYPLPAVTAAGFSLRFPWISPPGSLRAAEGTVRIPGDRDPADPGCLLRDRLRWVRLVDGGLVESSGAGTTADVLRALAAKCVPAGRPGVLRCSVGLDPADPTVGGGLGTPGRVDVYVRPAVLQLSNSSWQPDTDRNFEAGRSTRDPPSLFESLDPIIALMQSRGGRGREVYDRLAGERYLVANGLGVTYDLALESCDGDEADERVPLTWSLTKAALDKLDERVGTALENPAFAHWAQAVFGPSAPLEPVPPPNGCALSRLPPS